MCVWADICRYRPLSFLLIHTICIFDLSALSSNPNIFELVEWFHIETIACTAPAYTAIFSHTNEFRLIF